MIMLIKRNTHTHTIYEMSRICRDTVEPPSDKHDAYLQLS